jgi:transposase-like protein
MTNGSPMSGPIVPPAREGHRRQFSEADKRRIVEEAARPGASLSEVARGYGMAARVLFRWKQELPHPRARVGTHRAAGSVQMPTVVVVVASSQASSHSQEDCLGQFEPHTNAGFSSTCEPRTPAPSELGQRLERKWGC